jgi:hypothetical protein
MTFAFCSSTPPVETEAGSGLFEIYFVNAPLLFAKTYWNLEMAFFSLDTRDTLERSAAE